MLCAAKDDGRRVRAILPDDTPLLDLPGLVCGMPLPTTDTVLADAHGNPKVYKFNLQSHEQKMDLDGQLYNAPLSDEEDLGIPAHLAKPVPMDSMKAKAKAKPKKIFIIVGFIYRNTGLLKYKVSPPKTDIIIPPTKGI